MSDEKEVQRIVGIVRENARATLAKPVTQRNFHLAQCRNNWKRYAAGLTWRSGECERFATALDRATRELMDLMERGAAEEPQRPKKPWGDHDSVEGGMESVLVNEAAIEPQEPALIAEAPADSTGPSLAAIEAEYRRERESQPVTRPAAPLAPEVDFSEAVTAREEDRQAARFGFNAPVAPKTTEEILPPRVDDDLSRKVKLVLRLHQAAAKSDEPAPKSDEDR